MAEAVLDLDGVYCSQCEDGVTKTIRSLEGLTVIKWDPEKRLMIVDFPSEQLTAQAIMGKVFQTSFKCTNKANHCKEHRKPTGGPLDQMGEDPFSPSEKKGEEKE